MPPEADIDEPYVSRRWRSSLRRALGVAVVLVAIMLALLWANRREIADNVIADELARLGIPATYEIESIGGTEQSLRNIVVGDPARPDLTIERAEIAIRYRLGFPAIARLRLVRPRLFGTYRQGTLSFGALDPLIFTGEEGPFELPDLALTLVDGRALVESDYGPVGLRLAGSGGLRDGFAGELAATAPSLSVGGCEGSDATAFGQVTVAARRPAFEGPIRFGRLACPAQGAEVQSAAVQLLVRADEALAAFEGRAALRSGAAIFGDSRIAALAGDSRFTWRDSGLTARYDLHGADFTAPPAAVAQLEIDGSLRARRNFERVELDAAIAGRGVRPGIGLDGALAGVARSTGQTLLGPIVERIRRQLGAEGRSSSLAANITLRRTGERMGLVVPNASLRGGSGDTLLSLSRFQLSSGGGEAPRFAGNFATGGDGLPRITGRMVQLAGGGAQLRMTMAEYAAGSSRIAIPEMSLDQRADGMLRFDGEVVATGALPGGSAEALVLPVTGQWSPAGGLAIWDDCADVRFDRLQFANLVLGRQSLRLCPPRGTSIVRYGANGLRVAAGATSLAMAGHLGETPIAIRSGPIGLAWPGAVSARTLAVTLGPSATASTFVIDDLSAQIGDDIAGRFAGTDVRLSATPLDILGASGNWRYAGGQLLLTDGSFQLADRSTPDRFNPLAARGATLALEDNVISAEALLREPRSDRAVTRVDLRHDLSSGRGFADLAVDGLRFDDGLQPVALAERVRGIVANVQGTVTGSGRIDWTEDAVTSSGRFTTQSIDLAAAFGPVRGVSGTIEFSDLLGLSTAPDQRLRVRSINPGIEVNDGEVNFELRGGELLAVQGGSWPVLGGTLTMRPIDIRFGVSEVRSYVLELEGLDAALFVQRMELENISASGIFDGTVPIVFDEVGNGRIADGLLLSRPPGGNVSYVGELTYEDLSPMANFAFDTLRSLDYRQMRVALEGSLTGEIVTRVRFDGVTQGAGTQQNFVTRAIAGLPIRFDVNIRAPFYSLLGSMRALYDPAAIRDPRTLGLLDAEGNVIRRETTGEPPPPVNPDDLIPDEPAIQRRESEEMQ